MQPVKISIPGTYWDSFIYKGRLYLFCANGDIHSIAWDELMYDWPLLEESRIAFSCAFYRSDYLYSSEVQDLLRDPEIRPIMIKKFQTLAEHHFIAEEKTLIKYLKGSQSTPVLFPHADVEIYMDNLYVGSRDGLYQTSCNKKTKYPISTKPKKKWDGPVLSMSASYGAIALAAGVEGLYEYEINSTDLFGNTDPNRLAEETCRDCSWAYYSVFASSDSSGYLAKFRKNTNTDHPWERTTERLLERIESAQSIFGSEGYSWGVQDKLCQAQKSSIKVMKYEPWANDGEHIKELGVLELEEWKGEIISAMTANFGMIVELENAIVVYPSSGAPVTIPGEPVNWRVFPRSKRYENQLHIIYDDRLDILSFNHDYLVNQDTKISGFSVFKRISANIRRANSTSFL